MISSDTSYSDLGVQAKLSVTTACTPWCSLKELVPALAASGYDGIEVGLNKRSWNPEIAPSFWQNNAAMIDLEHAMQDVQDLQSALQQSKLTVVGIASYLEANNLTYLDEAYEVAAELGASFIRVRAPWFNASLDYPHLLKETRAVYRGLSERAHATGISALMEIHNNSICPSASAAMRVLEDLDPATVGVIFDPGNHVFEGYEKLDMALAALGPYLRHVHVKNAAFSQDAESYIGQKGVFSSLTEGGINWSLLLQKLHNFGYKGWYSLENFSETEKGLSRLKPDADWFRSL